MRRGLVNDGANPGFPLLRGRDARAARAGAVTLTPLAGSGEKPHQGLANLFHARSTVPNGRGILWRHTASFLTRCGTCQMLRLPAGKKAISPGPSRRISPFSSVT